MMLPTSSRSGKKTSKLVTPDWRILCSLSAVSSWLASYSSSPVAMSITSAAVMAPSNSDDSTSTDAMLLRAQVLEHRAEILWPAATMASLPALMADAGADADEVGCLVCAGDDPGELAVLHRDGVDGVEGLEDFLVRAQAERAQEDGAEELALAIDADVEDVLLVVLELNPANRGTG